MTLTILILIYLADYWNAHYLEIEKGRYIGVKTEDRIYKLCNTGVEDETHFLLQWLAHHV
jgi:hypothetical protein